MQIDSEGFFHLTYCTNIHPGEGWDEVNANLRNFAPALKAQLSPAGNFAIGLRLSARDARELLQQDRLERFRSFLDEHGLYVAILNGFPYGSFHRQTVKADVFAPDWRDQTRVQYTLDLIRVLARLLPDGLDGGISTLPLSYKPWIGPGDSAAWRSITGNLVRAVEALVRIRRGSGRIIHLDIEPEPDGLIESTLEIVEFFRNWLLPVGAPMLASALSIGNEEAETNLRRHIRICLDCCHSAVEYEDPAAALERLRSAGIQIGRVQISSALKMCLPAEPGARRDITRQLAPFAESTYLHQVIESRGDALFRFRDLPDALDAVDNAPGAEWRIHFHVPLFTEEYGQLSSTQDYVRRVLHLVWRTRATRHLEIETYTWEVLPPELKLDPLESIGREYRWVLNELRGAAGAASGNA